MTSLEHYSSLAALAAREHRLANERYWKAQAEGREAAFRELVFVAASHGIETLRLESSDQGDWMALANDDIDDDIIDELWAVSDLPDGGEPEWATQPGVDATISKHMGATATIDVKVAAEALLNPKED